MALRLIIIIIYLVLLYQTPVAPQNVVTLRDLNDGHTTVGQKVILECRTTFQLKHIELRWEIPKSVNSDILREKPVSNENITSSRLIIHEADVRHSGFYTCKVIHTGWGYEVYSKLWLPVYKKHEHVVEYDKKNCVFDVADAKIEIYIKGHPALSVTWMDNKNKTIKTNLSRYIIDTKLSNKGKFNYYSKLEFKNISYEDFGRYTVMADNGFEIKKLDIHVNLTDKLENKLSIENVSNDGMFAILKCVSTGYPRPNLSWNIIPNNSLVNIEEFKTNSQVISYISLNLSKENHIQCSSHNSQKHQMIEDTIFYAKNGFDIGLNNSDTIRKDGIIYAAFRETIVLYCVASNNKYIDEIKWYHNGKEMKKHDKMYLDKIVSSISLKYTSESQEGNYTCEALTRNGDIHLKSVTVVPKQIPSLFPKMTLRKLSQLHTMIGDTVILKCEVLFYIPVSITWVIFDFDSFNSSRVITNDKKTKIAETRSINGSTHISTSLLTISSVNLTDGGVYNCSTSIVPLQKSIWVPVFENDDNVITFDEDSAFDVKNMEIKILFVAHPPPTIQWFDNNGLEIISEPLTPQHSKLYYNYESTLRFQNLTVEDFGDYTVVVDNANQNRSYSLFVNLTKPTTYLDLKIFEKNKTSIIKCTAFGYPDVFLQWQYAKCTLKTCLDQASKSLEFRNRKVEERREKNELSTTSYISVDFSETGMYRCVTNGTFADLALSDVPNEFNILSDNMYLEDTMRTIDTVEGYGVGILCAISLQTYKKEIVWLYNGGNLHNMTEEQVYDLGYAFVSKISVYYTSFAPDGYYTCHTLTRDGFVKTKTVHVRKQDLHPFHLGKTNMNNNLTVVEVESRWSFYCYGSGFPKPTIKWFKDNQTIESSERIRFLNDKQELQINTVQFQDGGTYMCKISNGFSSRYARETLIISARFSWLYVLVPLLLIVLVILIAAGLFIAKVRKESKLICELKAAGLANFEKGDLTKLNPKLRIEDQADLLPYDRKWEIPMENVKIGKQLGSGAFGVVMKAEVVNFFSEENNKVVAVKTTRANSGFDSVKDLASELKIMAHLGKHINVVNLLGACTKNIAKRELYVVVEYCHLGNLHDYLLHHSQNFVNQKDPKSDGFDWTIGPDDVAKYVTFNPKSENVSYVNVTDSVKYAKEEKATFICSKDFLIWSFQIARGMEYLSLRRVVHGDLAARNVLLSHDNVAKISDFGLSKNMYQYGDYVKKNDGPLPVKWLAIETIGKSIFSVQSDVWSFGVVLWEIFSLGDTPYPGIGCDETFYQRLRGGYRMEAPEAATKTVYKMMLDCWHSDPLMRPSFRSLVDKIGSLLDESIKKHYIDLNNDYVLMNNQASESTESDYLTMVSAPTFDQTVATSSTYVPAFSSNPRKAEGNEN